MEMIFWLFQVKCWETSLPTENAQYNTAQSDCVEEWAL